MANTDMYKFQVIEGIIKAIDFKTKGAISPFLVRQPLLILK